MTDTKKLELVMVEWNDDRIKVLPQIPKLKKILREFIKNDKNKKTKANVLYLTSGINYIPKEYWEACKKHRMIQYDIESKRLVEVKAEVEKTVVNESTGKKTTKKIEAEKFSDFDSSKKEDIIKDTYDVRSLEKFLDEEKDSDIRLTIQKRIDEILNAPIDETIGHPEDHLKLSGGKPRSKKNK